MRGVVSSVTVASALELPELRRGLPEVVAGAASLERPIRWVHAGEVPNIASLLRGGELLLTTGMGIGPRAADQRRFVAELAARGVAAVVVELDQRFAGGLPKPLRAAAEQHAVPLVELHTAVRFVAVTEAIHTRIINSDHDLLTRAEALDERFTALMLEGGGVHGVLALLADAISNPVFLEADDGRLLAHAAPATRGEADPVAAWRQARAHADAVGVAVPVPSGGAEPRARRLVSLGTEARLDAFAAVAVRRAASTVALALSRRRQEDELVARERGDLLGSVAHGQIDPAAAALRARAVGFDVGRATAFLPLVARLRTPDRAAAVWTAALHDVERDLGALGVPTIVGVDRAGANLIIVLGLRTAADRARLVERAASVLRAGATPRGSDVVVAAGPAEPWERIGTGLREAIEATAVASALPARPWFDAGTMALDRLLWGLRDDASLERYVERMLGPVLRHDARRKHTLLPTLEALCAQGGRKTETARALHLNRQALYNRLARLQELLAVNLADPGMLLALHLAIRARRHVHRSD